MFYLILFAHKIVSWPKWIQYISTDIRKINMQVNMKKMLSGVRIEKIRR